LHVSNRLSLFGRIVLMPDKADAEKILTAFTLANWRRPLGRPCITEDYSAGPEIEQPLTK